MYHYSVKVKEMSQNPENVLASTVTEITYQRSGRVHSFGYNVDNHIIIHIIIRNINFISKVLEIYKFVLAGKHSQ